MWDRRLIIKFKPYLETLPTFFEYGSKLAGWAQNWSWSWRGQNSLVTSLVVLDMPRWKFRVIMGEETSARSPQKNIFRTSQGRM